MSASINWSFSKLMMYETCAFRFKLRYIDKIPEPECDANNPMERGNRIHNNLEAFVKGTETLDDNEAKKLNVFTEALDHLQTLYSVGMATAEDNWFYDTDWNVTDREHVWLWNKLDFLVLDEENGVAIIGDYKSGKSNYKFVEHSQQMQIYAATTALRYPDLQTIHTELWYVDEGHVKSFKYNMEDALRFVGHFDRRAQRIYNDKLFRANPNIHNCRYCPYGPRELGVCPVGV